MAEILVGGSALLEVATKADLDQRVDRLSALLARPHANFHILHGGKAPRAGNAPFVLRLEPTRPRGGHLWLLQWAWLSGDDPLAGQSTGNQTDVDTSATGAATPLAAVLGPGSGVTTYITGFEITGTGATAASVIAVTVTGIQGGTKTYYLAIPAGVLTPITPLIVEFTRPIPGAANNINITVNVPSFGAGNTNAAVTAHGFLQNPSAGASIPNVKAALLKGAIPTDANLSLAGTAWGGLDYPGILIPGLVVPTPNAVTVPDKMVVFDHEDIYFVLAGTGLVAGAANYHGSVGVIELPQTPEALTW